MKKSEWEWKVEKPKTYKRLKHFEDYYSESAGFGRIYTVFRLYDIKRVKGLIQTKRDISVIYYDYKFDVVKVVETFGKVTYFKNRWDLVRWVRNPYEIIKDFQYENALQVINMFKYKEYLRTGELDSGKRKDGREEGKQSLPTKKLN